MAKLITVTLLIVISFVIYYQFTLSSEKRTYNMIKSVKKMHTLFQNDPAKNQKVTEAEIRKTVEDIAAYKKNLIFKKQNQPNHNKIKKIEGLKELNTIDNSAQRDLGVQDDETEEKMIYSLDKEGIMQAFKDSIGPATKECYEAWLQNDHSLEGKFLVNITIDQKEDQRTSHVSKAMITKNELQHPLLQSCILNAVDALQFEAMPDKEPMIVNYPMVLKRSPSKAPTP
jgi:hypothetical protein